MSIGFHMQLPTNGWLDAVERLPAGTPVKAVNDGGMLVEAKQRNPGVFTILRHWYDEGQVFGGSLEENKARARAFFNSFVDGTFRDQYAPYIDAIEEFNEYFDDRHVPNAQREWMKQNFGLGYNPEYLPGEHQDRLTWIQAVNEVWTSEYRTSPELAHIRLVTGNVPIGNSVPLAYAQIVQQHDGLLGYHPYIYTVNGQPAPEDALYLSGRWIPNDAYFKANGVTVQWVGTEGGVYGSVVDGWKAPGVCGGNLECYLNALHYFCQRVRSWNQSNGHRFRGCVLFTTLRPDDEQWGSYHVQQPEMNTLADLAAQYPIGEPGPPPPPPPGPPPEPPPDDSEVRSFEDGWTDLSDRLQQPNGFTLSVIPAGQPLWYGKTATGTVEAKHMICGQSVPPSQCAGGSDPLILDGTTGFKIQAVSMATGTELKTTFGGDGRLLVSVPVQVHYQPPDVYDRVPPLASDDVFVSLILNGVEADRWTFPALPDREWIELSGEADAPVTAVLRFQTSYANSRDLFTDLWTAEEVGMLPDRAYGIDVSHHQGVMNWTKAAAFGVKFAFIKATQRVGYVDPRYQQNVAGARAAGILASAYHYYEPGYDPIAQAEHFWNTVKERGDLRLVLDVEEAEDGLAAKVAACLTRLQELSGWKPILYTGINFWNTYLKTVPTSLCDLWIADWTQSRDNPILPAGWHDWRFWQFTSDGNGPAHGAQSERIDTNWFNGTLDELKEYSEMIPDSVITAATAVRPHVAIRLHPAFALYKAIRKDGRDPVTPELSVPVDGTSYKYQYGQAPDGKQYLYVTYGPDWVGNMKVYPV